MRSATASSHVPSQEQTKFSGQACPSLDEPTKQRADLPSTVKTVRNVQPISFNDLARFAFPDKTDKHLSFHTGYDERTCRRWRAGDTDAPAEALGVLISEIMKRFHQR